MKFEENLKELEGLVSSMEAGSMPLEELIKAFEKGKRLVSECSKELESIRLKIEKVTATGVEELKPKSAGEEE